MQPVRVLTIDVFPYNGFAVPFSFAIVIRVLYSVFLLQSYLRLSFPLSFLVSFCFSPLIGSACNLINFYTILRNQVFPKAMDSYILPSTVYRTPSRQARLKVNTVIENAQQPKPASAATIASYYRQRRETRDFDDLFAVSESETAGESARAHVSGLRLRNLGTLRQRPHPALTRRMHPRPARCPRLILALPPTR